MIAILLDASHFEKNLNNNFYVETFIIIKTLDILLNYDGEY